MQTETAKRSYMIIFKTEFAISFTFTFLLIKYRKQIALFYANDDMELFYLLTLILPIASIMMLFMIGS